ncbi:MAG TPA: hypothetical protein VL371_21425 [Gemmataceae bacterium]|nr:hypothetical protein [Gemmataceae bacterium]
MKALFVCKGELRYWYPHIAAELKRTYGWDVDAVTFNTPSVEVVRRPGAFAAVYNLAEHLKTFYPRHKLAECVDSLEEFERDTGLNAYTLLYSDRILRDYPYERAVRLLAGVYDFWRTVLPEVGPNVLFGEIATATEWVGSALAPRYRVRPLVTYPTPVAARFFFIDRAVGMWEPMRRAYHAARDSELPPDKAARAADWLDAFHREKLKAPYLKAGSRSPFRIDLGRLVRRVGRIPFRVRTYLQDGFFEIGSYHGTHPLASVWANVAGMYRYAVGRGFVFRRAVTADKYVYFPLHVQPEYTTDVRAPFFTNQVALIENIAKTLPVGYRLVVKEHPGMQGDRPLAYYREINRLFNVELVSPALDSHDLIVNAAAVVTITGTSAWEAILYQKPAVVFGDLCYGFYDLTHHCPDVRDFPRVIREAVADKRPNRELLLKFVSALLETAHEGTINNPVAAAEVNSPANLARLARAVVRETGRDEHPADRRAVGPVLK